MATSALTKFNCFVEDRAEKVHNLATDVLKILLTNTVPVVTNTVKANITEISAGNGYSAGGIQAVQASSAQTAGVYKLVLTDFTVTAAGGSIGPFRYGVLYNDTSASDSLIGWYDYGANITLGDTESLDFDFDGTNGVLTDQ
jgi:hypothetical protein